MQHPDVQPWYRRAGVCYLVALAPVALAACGDEEDDAAVNNAEEGDDPAAEGCEHMIEGPSMPVVAAADAAGAPSATFEHARVDITLAGEGEQREGYVTFESGEATEHIFFLSADVPMTVTDAGGQEVAVEEAETSGFPCGEIAAARTFDLGVGPYTLHLGPTSAALVSLVFEEAGEHHHEE